MHLAFSGVLTSTKYASIHTTRGQSPPQVKAYHEWFSARSPVPHTYVSSLLFANDHEVLTRAFSIHACAYPTPSSFPHFSAPEFASRNQAFSALTATSASAELFSSYAKLLNGCVRRRADEVIRMGLNFDDIKELKDELWALSDAYAGDGWKSDDADALGEDEE